MGIVGEHPESGVRIDVQRARLGGPPWRYEGEVATPTNRHPMTAIVEADGTVAVEVDGEEAGGSSGVVAQVRLMIRAAYKHARDDGTAPPRHLVRWRPDR